MIPEDRIIELRKLAKGDGCTPWSESIAFARLIEAEGYRNGQVEMRERAAQSIGPIWVIGFSDPRVIIRKVEIKEIV